MNTRKKIDEALPLFCASREAKEGTVYDVLRKEVAKHPEGVTYGDLKDYLLANWKPAKSETYGIGYIRAYVTGAIKEDYLTQDAEKRSDYTARPKASNVEKAPKSNVIKIGKVTTKKKLANLDLPQKLRDWGNYESYEDSQESNVSIEDIVFEFGASHADITRLVQEYATEGLLATQGELVFLTEKGFNATKATEEV